MKTNIGVGYGWKFEDRGEWYVCNWADVNQGDLEARHSDPPTSDAKLIQVAIVPMGIWRGLSQREKSKHVRVRKKKSLTTKKT